MLINKGIFVWNWERYPSVGQLEAKASLKIEITLFWTTVIKHSEKQMWLVNLFAQSNYQKTKQTSKIISYCTKEDPFRFYAQNRFFFYQNIGISFRKKGHDFPYIRFSHKLPQMDSKDFFITQVRTWDFSVLLLSRTGHVNILPWMIYNKTRPATAVKSHSITLPCNIPLWGLVRFPSLSIMTFYYVLIVRHQTIISVLGVLDLKRKKWFFFVCLWKWPFWS